MPELPDVTVYVEALRTRISGHRLIGVTLKSPFLLRTADPPLSAVHGKIIEDVRRLGKQIVFGLDGDLWLAMHLKIAGRLHWDTAPPKAGGRNLLAAFEFDNGWLWLTEAGTQRRASLHLVRGEAGLQALDAGGIEPLETTLTAFTAALRGINHTLKRSLTDPHIFSGIGNAYSDEILYQAQLSPIAMTQKLTEDEVARLYAATQATLLEWTDRLRAEAARRISREGNRFSARHGGSRPLWTAVPALRRQGPAYPLRQQRDQLLRAMSDRRPSARRPRLLALASRGLAAHAGRT